MNLAKVTRYSFQFFQFFRGISLAGKKTASATHKIRRRSENAVSATKPEATAEFGAPKSDSRRSRAERARPAMR
jgi:hypothetical protein